MPEVTGKARLAVKLAVLLLFLLFSLSGVLPQWISDLKGGGSDSAFAAPDEVAPDFLKGVLPSMSPFSVFFAMIGKRALCIIDAIIVASLILGIAIWRGRFLCAWVCPMGTLAELEAQVFKKGLIAKAPKLNGIIFWTALTGALLGMPLLLALDPLSSFSRLGLLPHYPFPPAALVAMGMVLAVLALGVLKPMLWCARICPLGYCLGLAQRIRLTLAAVLKGSFGETEKETVSEVRRDILKGVCAGLPLAVASEGLLAASFESKGLPVLPPGAGNAVDFHSACTRCYACVAACPAKVITVKMPSDADVATWFAPQVSPDKSACSKDCNRCTQVCATGAIKPLSVDAKRNTQIGVARIDRSKCIAWSKGDACMVCDEYCPYHAIAIDNDPNGVARPVVIKSQCRGCGFCQMSCPAASPGPAIKVSGVLNQRVIAPANDDICSPPS